MSEATKRRQVMQEMFSEYPEPVEDQTIVQLVRPCGNNLHEVEEPSGTRYLVSMPTKFRKSIWVKRGDFVIVEPIAEGDKVKAEIMYILHAPQIKHLKTKGLWPAEFTSENDEDDDGLAKKAGNLSIVDVDASLDDLLGPNPNSGPQMLHNDDEEEESDDDSDLDLPQNPNHRRPAYEEEESSSSSESDDEE